MEIPFFPRRCPESPPTPYACKTSSGHPGGRVVFGEINKWHACPGSYTHTCFAAGGPQGATGKRAFRRRDARSHRNESSGILSAGSGLLCGRGPTGGLANRIWWLGRSVKGWSEPERPSKRPSKQETNTMKPLGAVPREGLANRIWWFGGPFSGDLESFWRFCD